MDSLLSLMFLMTQLVYLFSALPSISPPIDVETSGSGSGSADTGSVVHNTSGGHSGELSGSGEQPGSGDPSMSGDHIVSGEQPGSGYLSGSGDQVASGEGSASGHLPFTIDLSGSGSASADLPSGESSPSSTDVSGSGLSGEGPTISVIFSGALSGEGSASGGLQEAGEGSTEILTFPSPDGGSGLLFGIGDVSWSGSALSSTESGSSVDSSGEGGLFSAISSGFITSGEFSGFSGFPSKFSSGSGSGQSGELSGGGDAQILLIDDKLIDATTPSKYSELGGGLFSGSGDISGSGILSGDLSGDLRDDISGSASGGVFEFFSGVTLVGSGFTELTGSSFGVEEASGGSLLYSSGEGSGGYLSGFGRSYFDSGSGSGLSGYESSTSGEEGSVTLLPEDLTTKVSESTSPQVSGTLFMELGQGSVEYSGEGSSSGHGFYSGSGDTDSSAASDFSSSGDLPGPYPTSEQALTGSSTGPPEAPNSTELSETPGDVFVTLPSVVVPAGLAAPIIAVTPPSEHTPGPVEG